MSANAKKNGRNGATPEKNGRPEWADEFLKQFTGLGTVRGACRAVKIAPSTAYRLRDRDPEFAAEWDEREEEATDELEEEAKRRALDGSDTLLIFLLKSRRPNVYRERVSVEDDREAARAKDLDRASESELDEALTGIPDNVTPIRRAS